MDELKPANSTISGFLPLCFVFILMVSCVFIVYAVAGFLMAIDGLSEPDYNGPGGLLMLISWVLTFIGSIGVYFSTWIYKKCK